MNQYLQVIWCKGYVQNKVYSLDLSTKAFKLFARKPESQIVLRGQSYEPSFTTRNLEEPFDLWIYGTPEERLAKFTEWLSEMLEVTRQ